MVRHTVLLIVSRIVVANTGAALSVEALANPLLDYPADLAAGIPILPIYVDISEALSVKECDSFTSKDCSLTADVLLLAEAVSVY